jgi:hypothetical protein
MYLVCMSDICVCILLQYIQHTYTYKGGQSICSMYVYVLYVCAFIFGAYLVHIVHMLCILYVFFAAKIARRKIQTRYIRYIQIHTHMH